MLKMLATAVLMAAAAPALGAGEPATPQPPGITGVIGAKPSPWRLGIALGYGERSNPLVQSDDLPIFVDIDIAWFGEHVFFDNGDLGLTLGNNDRFTLNLIARFASERVFFGRTNTRFVVLGVDTVAEERIELSVPERDYAVELGIELLTDGAWGRLQLGAFNDVSNTHDGYEVFADYSVGYRQQRWYIEPSLALSYKSQKLNDYYWGVRPSEGNNALAPYRADAGLNARLRLAASYQLTPHWAASVAAEYERINDEAAASPIVEDDHVLGFFAGLRYEF